MKQKTSDLEEYVSSNAKTNVTLCRRDRQRVAEVKTKGLTVSGRCDARYSAAISQWPTGARVLRESIAYGSYLTS